MINQTGNYVSKIWINMKTYPLYWIIGALVFYILFWCRRSCESFYDVDWDQLGPAYQSFGRTQVVAKLNDAVWDDCMPNGEYYVMRYTEPKCKPCMYSKKQAKPIRKGYYNACGEQI
jgi:hypothetical protein